MARSAPVRETLNSLMAGVWIPPNQIPAHKEALPMIEANQGHITDIAGFVNFHRIYAPL